MKKNMKRVLACMLSILLLLAVPVTAYMDAEEPAAPVEANPPNDPDDPDDPNLPPPGDPLENLEEEQEAKKKQENPDEIKELVENPDANNNLENPDEKKEPENPPKEDQVPDGYSIQLGKVTNLVDDIISISVSPSHPDYVYDTAYIYVEGERRGEFPYGTACAMDVDFKHARSNYQPTIKAEIIKGGKVIAYIEGKTALRKPAPIEGLSLTDDGNGNHILTWTEDTFVTKYVITATFPGEGGAYVTRMLHDGDYPGAFTHAYPALSGNEYIKYTVQAIVVAPNMNNTERSVTAEVTAWGPDGEPAKLCMPYIEVSDIGPSSMDVTVKQADFGEKAYKIDGVHLRWSVDEVTWHTLNKPMDDATESVTFALSGLAPSTKYYLDAYVSSGKYTSSSEMEEATTLSPVSVSGVTVSPADGQTALQIDWQGMGMPGTVEYYHIIIKREDASKGADLVRNYHVAASGDDGAYSETVALGGHTLVNGNTYWISVQPHYAGQDQLKYRVYKGYKLTFEEPAFKPSLSATLNDDGSVSLVLETPANVPAGIYDEPKGVSFFYFETLPIEATGTTAVMNAEDLIPGVTYRFHAEAYYGNAGAADVISTDMVEVTIPPLTPETKGLVITPTALSFTLESEFTGGRVDRMVMTNEIWSEPFVFESNTGTYSATGLEPDTDYTFVFYAETNGVMSVVREVVLRTLPLNAITGLEVTAASAAGVDLTWDAYSFDEGVQEAAYKIYRKGGDDADFVLVGSVDADTTVYADATVAAETDYTYRVTAEMTHYLFGIAEHHTECESYPSNEVAVTTPAAVEEGFIPQPPEVIDIVLTPTAFSFTLSLSNAISPHDTMHMVVMQDGQPVTFDYPSLIATHSSSGLDPDTDYTFDVYSMYNGVKSEVRTVTLRTLPINAVTGLTASAVTANGIGLTWDAYDYGDKAALTGYEIYRKGPGDADFVTHATVSAAATGYTDMPLTTGKAYSYRVVAKLTFRLFNLEGFEVDITSNPSNDVTATTLAASSKTLTLTARPSGVEMVDLSWTAVEGATGYVVAHSVAGGAYTFVHTAAAGVRAWTDTGVSPNVAHEYTVTAITGDGAAVSNAAKATIDFTLENRVTVSRVSAATTAVRVSWSMLTYATGYEVERAVSGTDAFETVYTATSGLSNIYTDTAPAFDTAYTYRVTPISAEVMGIPGQAAITTTRAVADNGGSSSGNNSSDSGNFFIFNDSQSNTNSSNTSSSSSSSSSSPRKSGSVTRNTVTVVDSAVPMAGPAGAVRVGFEAVQLNWTAVDGATGYVIKRSDGASDVYMSIGETGQSETSFVDLSAGIQPNAYHYSVEAVMSGDADAPEINMITEADLGSVQGLALTLTETGSMLDWQPYEDASEYHLYMNRNGVWQRQAILFGNDNTSYLHEATDASDEANGYFVVATGRVDSAPSYESAGMVRAVLDMLADGGWRLRDGQTTQVLPREDAMNMSALCLESDATGQSILLSAASSDMIQSGGVERSPVWPLDTSLVADHSAQIGEASDAVMIY